MKARYIVSAAISLLLLAGCASDPKSKYAYSSVLVGMSRNNVRYYFGEPLRVVPAASGGEDWYYNVASWHPQLAGESGTRPDPSQPTTYANGVVNYTRQVDELPVHISADGFVIEPLPKGKVLKNLP